MPDQWKAMLAEYRFTRTDGHPLTARQQREMDDSMFELIGGWAQQRGLAVEGQALFERMGDDLPDGASR
ncbi:hypothetical protein [Deinococcus marmoris]|nr:hypothetical protein [Deinococcus marmoris]